MNDRQVFEHFFPPKTVDFCFSLWKHYNFTFKIKPKRSTKLGDYRFDPSTSKHTISINNDLNRYSFLITYLHEVAHLITFKKYKHKVAPHGKEWKEVFKDLMRPVVMKKVFPDILNKQVIRYMQNPKASSCNDHNLSIALNQYDANPGSTLQQLATGDLFKLGTKTFRKQSLRRTRYICQEMKTGRKYLISKSAQVKPLVESHHK
ncbi:MAG: SprT-like domain-containing protein [Bacteroidota bacterium]